MSVILNGANQHLKIASPKGTYPFSVSIWFKTADVSQGGSNRVLACNGIGAVSMQNIGAIYGATANYPLGCATYNGSWHVAYQVAPWTQNATWHHALFVWESQSSRRVYLDGASKGVNTGSQNATTCSWFTVGARNPSSPSLFFNGQIAEVAFYGSALGDTDAAALGLGGSPLGVDQANLLNYWRLIADATSSTGGTALTPMNAPTYNSGDHPSINLGFSVIITGSGAFEVTTPSITVHADVTLSGQSAIVVPAPTVTNVNHIGEILTPWGQAIRGPGFTVDVDSVHPWGPAIPKVPHELGAKGTWSKTPDADRSQPENKTWTGDNLYQSIERVWFEHTHLLPRLTQEVGNVITERTIPCDLYNADRTNAVICTSIDNNLGDGLQVLGVPPTPFTMDPQDGFAFQIKVLQSGALRFDGTYTFNFNTGESQTIRITGSRIILLPYRPEAPLKEHLVFDTRILEAIDSTEQRRANREFPRGVFEMNLKGNGRRVECILFDRLSKVLAIPAWHEPSFLSQAVTVGDTVINVNTTNYANFYVGGNVIILKDEFTYDVAKIEAMTATTITLDTATANSFDVDTQVMPLMTAYVEATAPVVKALVNESTIKLKAYVNACDNDIADASGWSTYNGKVFLDDPNLVDGKELAETLRTKVFVLDNLTGDRSQFSQWAHAIWNGAKGWKTRDRATLWKLRKLLHFLKGRQVSFYIPTFTQDLWPKETLVNATSSFTMDLIGYTVNVYQRWPKQVFRLILKNGTILIRTIVNSVEATADTEQLTVDTPWPYDIQPADIERIEFLQKVRLDTDDIVITHYNALGQATCIVPTKEVTD